MLQTHALNSVLNDNATLKIALNFLVEGSKHLANGQTGAWETRECYLCNISIGKPDVAWKKCQTPGGVHSWQLLAKEVSSFLSSIRFRHSSFSWDALLCCQDGPCSVSVSTFLHAFPQAWEFQCKTEHVGSLILHFSGFRFLSAKVGPSECWDIIRH